MELLAIRPGRQKTPAKSLVIPQAGEGANVMPHRGTPTFYGLKPIMKARMPKPIYEVDFPVWTERSTR